MKVLKVVAVALGAIALISILALLVSGHDIPVLNPKGIIGSEQRQLMIFATVLMLIVVVPVFVLTGLIAWKYREGNTKAKYEPDRDGSKVLEAIWWGLPLAIILILSVVIWKSSHALDPFKPLDQDKTPLKIQVIALQWKWLFLYPDHDIATVNFVQFPEDTPVDFEITADSPMNSFWIPSLGGQIYAMTGMSTQLHLLANEPGDYDGSSANISGEGFAGMRFKARASSDADFNKWVSEQKKSQNKLSQDTYNELAEPSKNEAAKFYSAYDPNLYNTVVMKYMAPGTERNGDGDGHESSH